MSAVRIMVNVLVELMIIRTYCAALDMRSNTVFAILNLTGMFLGFAVDALGASPFVRTAVIAPAVFIVLPVAYSKGPLRQRITRCAIICTAMMIANHLTNLILIGMIDPSLLTSFDSISPSLAVLVSIATLLSSALTFETLLLFFRRHDKMDDFYITPSLVVLLLWSYALTAFSVSFATPNPYSLDVSLTFAHVAYYVLLVFLCVAAIAMFREDVYATGRASKHTASARQSKHMRAEIDAAVRRAAIARRLHHELASTTQWVVDLAYEGNTCKANAYLDALRAQAQSVTQGIPAESGVSHCDQEAQ